MEVLGFVAVVTMFVIMLISGKEEEDNEHS